MIVVYRGKYKEFIESVNHGDSSLDYSERHHIIPRCLGGTDEAENIIELSLQEHFLAHKILYEENPENTGLFCAYWMMCNTRADICTPEDYERAKIIARKKISELNQGRKFTDSHKFHLSDSLKGRKLSSEHIVKMSNSLRGKSLPANVRFMISETLKGECNPMNSEENRRKVSESKLGKIWVNNGIDMTYIEPKELEQYLSSGYQKGMIKRKGSTKKDYECHCRICGKDFLGGKYASVCPECYSDMKRKERLNGGFVHE